MVHTSNPLPDQIKLSIDIIDFQLVHIRFHEDKNRIRNDQLELLIVK